MTTFEYTGKGCRQSNQDYVKSCSLSKWGAAIYVVADGMGGYQCGDMAAKTVVESIIDYVVEHQHTQKPGTLLKSAFAFANDSLSIQRLALGVKDMGCVVATLLLIDDTAYIAWLGDSRIYMYREGKEVFRSRDHSIVEELSAVKALTASDLEQYSSVVTRAIMGDNEDVTPDLMKVVTAPGDIFLLTTDGVHKQLNIPEVISLDSSNLQALLDASSIEMADNYSMIRVTI